MSIRRIVKLYGITTMLLIGILLALAISFGAGAQESCYGCRITGGSEINPTGVECYEVPHGTDGNQDCDAYQAPHVPSCGWPLASQPHCHFSGDPGVLQEDCSHYCPDNNQNGTCDQFEPEDPEDCPGVDCSGSPIVIRLSGHGPWRFNGPPVMFDIDGDGDLDKLASWPAIGSRIAFLWYDRNDDGAPNDGSELWGDWKPTSFVNVPWSNGFQWLAIYETQRDGSMDIYDEPFLRLRLWEDRNRDGVGQLDEQSYLSDSGITAIDLNYTKSGRHDQGGTEFRYKSKVTRNGHAEPIYDVYFKILE